MTNRFGYYRIGCVTPELNIADVKGNANEIIRSAFQAYNEGCDIIVFPELSLTGYTCADLFMQGTLHRTAFSQLFRCAEETAGLDSFIAIGLPVFHDGRMYNCAALLHKGTILGLVPKTYIPNHNEFYEKRWFTSGADTMSDIISIRGCEIPFGTDLLFRISDQNEGTIGIELCEDMWAPVTPSSMMCLAGADIILNLSASNELAGKADYRRSLVSKLSGQQLAAYAYCSAGVSESTTDTVYGGHRIIAENGHIITEGNIFERDCGITVADVDIDFLSHERINNRTFSDCASIELVRIPSGRVYRIIETDFRIEEQDDSELLLPNNLKRVVDPRPFVPSDSDNRTERCREIFSIQSSGLSSRLKHIGCKNVVIGLSGGLDSTLALLVTIEAFKNLGLALSGINCITMPGFGTTKRTKGNAELLCEALGLDIEIIDITAACRLHFDDIGHDGETTDITYENTQARERTQILMDTANKLGGIVIGTGDLSEQAMGWSTYNGDHMSMYAVNTGVPKTLVRFLVEYYIDNIADKKTASVLSDINATPISPELLPPDKNGKIAQKTEEKIGPYELHDFFLYHVVRCGFEPLKVIFLAEAAFSENKKKVGNVYTRDEIKKWLKLFYRRFFSQQFKRSCVPDGPKVGTIALSPRADWRMPSDASVQMWLEEIEYNE